jgi:hypothetical protein
VHTLQSVNGPLLELLESDFRRRRYFINVQAVRIILLLVCWGGELSLFGVNNSPSFGINAMGVLSNHGVCIVFSCREMNV